MLRQRLGGARVFPTSGDGGGSYRLVPSQLTVMAKGSNKSADSKKGGKSTTKTEDAGEKTKVCP